MEAKIGGEFRRRFIQPDRRVVIGERQQKSGRRVDAEGRWQGQHAARLAERRQSRPEHRLRIEDWVGKAGRLYTVINHRRAPWW